MAVPYESDLTRFIRDLKAKNPEIVRDQRAGRAIWWDKDIDPELYRRFGESTLSQPGYVYNPRSKT
jgi:hypothetical protein